MKTQKPKDTPSRKERLQAFCNELLNAAQNGDKTSKGVKAVERVAAKIRTQMRFGEDKQKLSLNTIKTYYTDLRKLVTEQRTEFEKTSKNKDFFSRVLNSLKLTKEEEEEILNDRAEYREKISNRVIPDNVLTDAADTSEQTLTPLYDFEGLIKHAQALITPDHSETPHYYKIAVGLMLLTGRRATEIFKTGSFELVAGEPQKVLFKGQLKKRKVNSKGVKTEQGAEDTGYIIPVLADAKTVINALNLMRETANEKRANTTLPNGETARPFSEMSVEDINTSTANSLGIYTRKEFAEWLGGDISAHSLRKAYLTVSFHKYVTEPTKAKKGTEKPKKMGLSEFARNVLGHSGGVGNEGKINDLTTNTYLYYKIISTPKPTESTPTEPQPTAPTSLLKMSVKDRLIWVVDNILLNASEPAPITQHTLKKAYFEQFNSTPDYLAMRAIIEGTQTNKKKEKVELSPAVLDTSKRIQAHNEGFNPKKK